MKKGKMVLVSFCLALMMACPLLLTGCDGGRSGDISVIMMVNPEQGEFYQDYFAELGEELGVKIDYVGYPYQDYYQQLKIAMQDNPPDLFYIRPGDIKKLCKEGQLQNLRGFIDSEAFKEDVDVDSLFPNVMQPYTYDGQNVGVSTDTAGIYGINLGFSYQGMGYNRKLVQARQAQIEAAGLTVPWELEEGKSYTFEQFQQLLQICTTSNGGGLEGKDAVYGMNVPKDQFLPFVWSLGGDIIDGSKVTVDTPQFKQVLNFINAGIDGGYISKEYTWGEWSSDKLAFFTEVGSWEVAGYEALGFSYDMMPWPTVNGDDAWYGQIGTSAIGVSAKSANLDVAQKIAASFLSARTLDKMLKKGLTLPMVTEVANNGYLTDNDYKPEHRKIFIDVISGDNGKLSPINNTYNSEWFDKLTGSLDAVWNKTQSVNDFLAQKQNEMQELYDRQESMA